MTTDELISQMAALLKHGDNWQARAFGRDFFAKGKTPREAMERALGLAKVAEDHWVRKIVPASVTLAQTVTPQNSEAGAKGFEPSPGKKIIYCAKASKKDREVGNNHPTVKPTELMRYLTRLVTPPGGTVLDMFMGSGSTGKAALLEGFKFIGIEMDDESFATAQRRVAA